MFTWINTYFLGHYEKSDYIIRQRARLFFIISILFVILATAIAISLLLQGTTDLVVVLPAILGAIYALFSIFILRKGYLTYTAHSLLLVSLLIIWFVLFIDTADVLQQMDSIVLVQAFLFLTPLVITKHKYGIPLYICINIVILIVFAFYLQDKNGLTDFERTEYIVDNVTAFIFVGAISYLIFTIYTNALSRALESELTIQRQYDEIQGQNEELKAANEEFEAINEELSETYQEINLAHETLSQDKELLSTTMRSIGDGVITTDKDGAIILFSNAAEKLSGMRSEDVAGKRIISVFNIVDSETGEHCPDPALKIINDNDFQECHHDVILIDKEGNKRDVTITGGPIHDNSSAVIGAVVVMRDITERKKMEEELQKTSKIETLGIFAGGIAHDFNNLLTSIIGNISIAKHRMRKDDEIYNILSTAEEVSLKTKDLTHQLLTFTKGGEPIKEISKVDEIIINTINFVLSGSHIRCSYTFPDDLWNVFVDPGQISQVIHNIILNAMQAVDDNGEIHITAENMDLGAKDKLPIKSGKYLKIIISDQGPGIPEEDLEKVFDPFFTTKKNGSGLGLSISHSIIKKHNGHIAIRTEVGRGTTFEIYLPATEEKISEVIEDNDNKSLSSGKILVLDDDGNVLNVVSKMLCTMGFSVSEAYNGEEAIEKYKAAHSAGEDFDCVIMDLTVRGGMGGKKAVQILKEYDPGIRAIVSSGYANDPVMSNYLEYGFVGAIRKPYRLEELRIVLASVLDRI